MKGQLFIQVSRVSYSLISKDQDTYGCQKPLFKRVWCLSSGAVCAHDKSDRERSWSSGSAFGKFWAHRETVASKAGWHKEKSWFWTHCGTSPFFPVGNCINPTGKLVHQAVAAGVWKDFSQGTEQKNNLVGSLHFLFSIQTLQGTIIYGYFCRLHSVGWG